MSDGTRCTGHCCREVPLVGIGETPEAIETFLRTKAQDGDYIADMLIPLRPIVAGTQLPDGTAATEPYPSGWLFTCRHFNIETNDCGAYDTRPRMCSEYPYGRDCRIPACTLDGAKRGEHPPANKARRHLPVLQNAIPEPRS